MKTPISLSLVFLALIFTTPSAAPAADALDLDGIWNVTIGEALTVKLLGADSASTATTMTFDAAGASGGSFSYDLEAGGQDFAPTGAFSMIGGGKKFAWSFDSPGSAELSSYLKAWIVEWLQSGGHSVDVGSLSLSLQALTSKPMKMDRTSGAPLTGALKVKGALSGTIDGAARTLKLKYAASFTFSSEVGIDSQLTDASNWQVIATFDQKDTSGTPTYETSGLRRKRAKASSANPQLAIRETGDRTYTASGLVAEYVERLYADDEYVVVGGIESGFSRMALSDLDAPRGKSCNYKGRDSNDAALRFGLSGFAKGTADDRIYAWYGRDIVDVLDLEIVFEDAPDFTHMMGPTPQDRFVSDENGDFWVGTNNLNDDGSLQAGNKVNGLYKIAADFSGISTMDAGLAVWNIFKDTAGVIWIGSKSGIHRRSIGGSPQLVYNSASTAWYPEQIIESGGEIYAVLKNFFNDPWNLPGNRVWELHQWDSNAGQFNKVCDIVSGAGWDQVHAFVYSGALYVVRSGNQTPLAFDPGGSSFAEAAAIGEAMGQYRLVSTGAALFSVGNVPGVCIYNLDGGGETLQPTPAGTAEGLIADYITTLYSDRDKRMFIGPRAAAFNIYDHGEFAINEIDDFAPAVGFFEYNGKTYIQMCTKLFKLENGNISEVRLFPNNGEKIVHDQGRVWALIGGGGGGRGAIAVLDLDSLAIKGTLGSDGNGYWDTAETWTLDRDYEFHDAIPVPHEDAVFVAVGEVDALSPMPWVLKYSYADNTFTRVNLPDPSCEGIRALATDGQVVYGAARKKLYVYEDGAWQEFCDLEMGNDFRGMKIANRHLFIISGWNSDGEGESGGMEVVDLREKTSGHYDSTRIPIPSDAIFTLEVQGFDNDTFKLWLGGPSGLSYCEFRLEE